MSNQPFQKSTTIPLDQLYLDPNNYRFIDEKNYKEIADEDLTDTRIQKRTLRFITGGDKNGNIKDLVDSFLSNGYLNVDVIQVEEIQAGAVYKVVEGNRRIATLKYLQQEHELGNDIGEFDEVFFDSVPVTIISEQQQGDKEMVAALKHISGNKRWPTLNQAQLLYDLIYKYQWAELKVTNSLGITLHKLRRDLRTIALIELYKKSDYGDQFETNMFNIFREIISSTDIKRWLGWDDANYTINNVDRQERLFSWLSSKEDEQEDEDGNIITRTTKRVITQGDQIRTLASIIDDEVALEVMEQQNDITEAYSISTKVADKRYKSILTILQAQVDQAKPLTRHSDEQDKQALEQLRDDINGMLVSIGGLGGITSNGHHASSVHYTMKSKQLSTLTLQDYKFFEDGFSIGNFNRINIFAGNNNSGKTSILEAIHLLCHLNDFNGLIDLYKRRGKFHQQLPVQWLSDKMPPKWTIRGSFDDKDCLLNLTKSHTDSSVIDKTNYISSLNIHTSFNDTPSNTKVILKKGKEPYELQYEHNTRLCNIVFSSPFSFTDRTILEHYYNVASDKGAIRTIIQFIRQEIDASIEDIQRVGSGQDFRFNVTFQDQQKRPLDLTEFGDGLQRIFHISLMIVAAQYGIICIDEIENAIHHNLLVQFTEFIQKLAHEYHVQIFASTHSQECIQAFFDNHYKNEEITGFRLERQEKNIQVTKAEGVGFKVLIEDFGLDLRG